MDLSVARCIGRALIVIATVVTLGSTFADAAGLTQSELDNVANNLVIKCKILENHYNGDYLNRFRISLGNGGTVPIPGSGWVLYFHRFYMLFPDVFPGNKSYVMEKENVKVNMIQGDLYSLEPIDGFGQLLTHQSRDLDMTASFWSVLKTDFMPNWYLTSTEPSVEPRIVTSTASLTLDFVEPFTNATQWKRYPEDQYNPFTPEDRWRRLSVVNTGKAEKLVIPTPKETIIDDSGQTVTIDASWKIYTSASNVQYALESLVDETKLEISQTSLQSKVINLAIDNTIGSNPSAYDLRIDAGNKQVMIKGRTPDAIYYAVQSLLSILHHFNNQNIPHIVIVDEPRFEFRGFYLDISRHFQTLEDIKRLIRSMAMYKLNKLHIHLADDEGWRLEIPGLPELTSVGGNRCHDLEERSCIIPQYGSGPQNDTSGSGFLTVEQYKDLLTYAVKHHIEVIPEFDMPGHAHAAIKSMEERYRKLMGSGQADAAEEFLLSDPDDESEYKSVQQWTDNAINPCQESTYHFIGHVLDKLTEMHNDVQPLKTYHFGGDEVAGGAWEKSPRCNVLIKQHPEYNVTKGLKKYFAQRVANLTAQRGLALRGWEDGFIAGEGTVFPLDDMDNKDLSSNAWDNVWEWGAADRAYTFANAGYKVVMSQATHLYYDHPYEPDPEERGLYWATRFTDTWKTFGFLPDSLYDNIDTKRSGETITVEEVCGADMSKCAALEKPENIIGMQAHLWSENIHNSEHMDYMIYPRMLALAERAWHKAPFEQSDLNPETRQQVMKDDWQTFANVLGHRELKRLDKMGVMYRVPPPGGRYHGNSVEVSTTFPGLPVQYKSVHGSTWMNVTKSRYSWSENSIQLRTLSTDMKRSSRIIEMKRDPISQGTLDSVARSLSIKARVLDNLLNSAHSHQIRITMKNTGVEKIPSFGWALYFHSFFILYPNIFPKQMSLELTTEKITVRMIQGDLYSIEPSLGFVELAPNESRYFDIDVAVWSVQRTDFMPNWYVASSDTFDKSTAARVITSTSSMSLEFVEPFEDVRQWKRYNMDQYNPYTAQDRYKRFNVKNTGMADKMILPTPKQIQLTDQGTVSVDSNWRIHTSSSDANNAASYITDKTSILRSSSKPANKVIEMIVDGTLDGPSGSYSLDINPQKSVITLTGLDSDGLFNAASSLVSLLDGYNMQNIPGMTVNDEPRFEFRGFYLDISRHFHTLEDIKRLIRSMAMYKLNKLHIHLADDEGWRLEIPGLPELTSTGGYRCHDIQERSCIIPQFGSGPHNDTSGSGFLTVEQYKDLLTYAVKHHIEVIPEFDMPGHAHAAIKSMDERHRKLMEAGDPVAAKEFLLSEAEDKSVYITVQQWMDNAINTCQESTYHFIGELLDRVVELHKDIQPLKTYHFGGDEVAKGAWEKSPSCISLFERYPEYNISKGLKKYFAQRVANLTAQRGLALRGWEDGFIAGEGTIFPLDDMDNKELSSNAWDNVWEWGAGARAYEAANAGYKVVMSHASHLYYDHPYEPDPEERGLYWATRWTDTLKSFSYLPDDLYGNMATKVTGEEIIKSDICGDDMLKCPALHKPENIIGIQGHLWSETIHTSEHMDYMIYPRMLAMAERAWHKAPFEQPDLDQNTRQQRLTEDWQAFANTLGHKEMKRLDEMGILYRVPPPGGMFEGDTVHVVSSFPGLSIQYSGDNGNTWTDITNSQFTWQRENVLLRTLSADGKRNSRVVELTRDEGLPWSDQPDIDYIGSNLGVHVTVIDNLNKQNNSVPVKLRLTNNGGNSIEAGNWRIHFYSLYGVLLQDLSCGLRVGHVDGALYYVTPSSRSFPGIPAGETIECTYLNKYWSTSRTDFFPNWFVSALGMKGKVLNSTTSEDLEYVGDFATDKQWKRQTGDMFNPYTPRQRYDKNDEFDSHSIAIEKIVPTPSNVNKESDRLLTVSHAEGWVVVKSEAFPFEASYVAEKLDLVLVDTHPSNKFIVFSKTSKDTRDSEAYTVSVDPDARIITISASDASGALNAAQTLISLSERGDSSIPHVTIQDTPRFPYRGVMLDVARNFKSKEWVLQFLDTMSRYKLNHLHFHVTDDEGWRVEIPGIPELTQVGSKRCHSDYIDKCTTPQLGSGPDIERYGSGYYTVEDYREILQVANDLHITVIPEVEGPVHATAAVVSMAAREENITKAAMYHDEVPESYRLSDLEYANGEEPKTKWRQNALNPCLNSTFQFLEKVLDGFIELHRDIQTLKTFHIGGDEVPEGVWDNSPSCQSIMADGVDYSTKDLQREYALSFADIVSTRNIAVAAWEDGLYAQDGPEPLASFASTDVHAYVWHSEWKPNSLAKRVSEFADAGYKVVMPLSTHLYLDHPYEPDPEERGLYWASKNTDTKKVFSFMPDDVFANADTNKFGEPVNMEEVCGGPCPKPTKPENIIGIQAVTFSETLKTNDQYDYMAFPRLLAMAERAWHKDGWESTVDAGERNKERDSQWNLFRNNLGQYELPRLEDKNIHYRIPPPGARMDGNYLEVNTLYPGHDIEFSLDNGLHWSRISGGRKFLPPGSHTIHVRTKSLKLHRVSRSVVLHSVTVSRASSIHSGIALIVFVLNLHLLWRHGRNV